MCRNETLVVHKGEGAHNKLAIHSISNATVTRNGVTEILDLERALDTGGEEAAKGSHEAGKGTEDQNV